MTERTLARVSVAAVFLFGVALATSLLFINVYPLPMVQNDAVGYLEVARNVAAGRGFTQDGTTPMLYRPPLFSVLLGCWYFLTGTSSVFSAAVFQSLELAVGVLAAFLLFLELTPSFAWAVAAALWSGLEPPACYPAGLRPAGADAAAVHDPRRVAFGAAA